MFLQEDVKGSSVFFCSSSGPHFSMVLVRKIFNCAIAAHIHIYIYKQTGFIIFIVGINTSTSNNVTQKELYKCSVEINDTLQEEPCTEWQYDDSVFESTLVN